jgi:hypothetical protein
VVLRWTAWAFELDLTKCLGGVCVDSLCSLRGVCVLNACPSQSGTLVFEWFFGHNFIWISRQWVAETAIPTHFPSLKATISLGQSTSKPRF